MINVFAFNLSDAITALNMASLHGLFLGFLFGLIRFLVFSPVERKTP